jgi:sulfur relay (sulfurtransferase) complex TusBCD TusD component (DsrE family)
MDKRPLILFGLKKCWVFLMEQYLLIESRDQFESNEVQYFYDLAIDLKIQKNDVKLFFLQNAAFSLRKNIPNSEQISNIIALDIPIFVDEFSAKERGIFQENLRPGIMISSLEIIIEHMLNHVKVIWHS